MARVLQLRRGTNAENNLFTGAVGELTVDTDNEVLRIHDGSTVGGTTVGLDAGFVASFAGSTAPDGWLVCDGSAVSRTNYARLFAAIGTTYGDGDGSTTFNLPDLSDCFVQGGTAGTSHNAGLPNIKGTIWAEGLTNSFGTGTGAFSAVATGSYRAGGSASADRNTRFEFDANSYNSIYSDSVTTVQPKSVEMTYCIKY